MIKTKKELLFGLLILFSVVASAQQWYSSQVQRARDVNSVVILNPNAIVIGGGHQRNDSVQSIFQSNNQGLSWNIRTDDRSSWIKSIAFKDTVKGYAVGFDGKILSTNDGGLNWARINSPTSIRHFNKIIFVDSINAFIAGGWQSNDSVQTILKSVDGGNSWNIIYDQSGYWLKSIYFIDAQKGFAVGEEGIILRTTNGGSQWATVSSPIQRDFNALTFINDTIGYIVGGNRQNDSIRTILQTTDGGDNWSVLKDELGGWLTDIYFLNRDTGYIVGYQATFLKTTNGGWTWTHETVNSTQGDEYFNTVRFYNENFGVIGGGLGKAFIYTNSSFPQAQTTGHAVNDSTRVDMFGSVNTAGYPGLFWFVFSPDSTFSSFGQTYPQNIQSDTFSQVTMNVGGLLPNTIYYYYVKAKTFEGTDSGNTLALFTFKNNIVVSTLSATEVKNASARLNAEVDKFPVTAALSFEYGLTNSLGSEIAASPSQIIDTLMYRVSAELNGLQSNSLYYFRIKATFSQGINFYGQVQQLYTGNPIPNWDFQLWQEDTVQLPRNWTPSSDDFERVAGNTGDYALKLSKGNLVLLGKILPDDSPALLHDGIPFNTRPDSIIGYFNYYVEPGDTAFMLVILTSNGSVVAFQPCPIAGNSGGNFERLSYKINYNSPAIPDSLAMGIVTINPFDTIEFNFADNFLIVDEITFTPTAPAIANMGFENWMEYAFSYLLSWSYLKYLYTDNIARGDTPIVTRTFFEPPSDYAAEIRNINSGGHLFYSGEIALHKDRGLLEGGGPFFPVSAKHQTLNGYLQFYPVNGDSMEIMVEMYHQGVQIGRGSVIKTDSATYFQPFSVPINYTSPLSPDSGSITIGMMTAKGPSILVIDKLAFDGFAFSVGVENPVTISSTDDDIQVYPNPAKHLIIVEMTNKYKEQFNIQLIDLNGQVNKNLNIPGSQNRTEIETTDIRPGLYILNFKSANTLVNRKIVILN